MTDLHLFPQADAVVPVEPQLAARLMKRCVVAASGCWEWPGERTGVNGYGRVRVDGRKESVHRLAYEAFVGPIPTGQHVLHRCDNPPCWRPDHLFTGTLSDNKQDEIAKGRNYQASKTHCDAGHPYNEANIYRAADGARRCKECRRAAVRRYRAKRQAA